MGTPALTSQRRRPIHGISSRVFHITPSKPGRGLDEADFNEVATFFDRGVGIAAEIKKSGGGKDKLKDYRARRSVTLIIHWELDVLGVVWRVYAGEKGERSRARAHSRARTRSFFTTLHRSCLTRWELSRHETRVNDTRDLVLGCLGQARLRRVCGENRRAQGGRQQVRLVLPHGRLLEFTTLYARTPGMWRATSGRGPIL